MVPSTTDPALSVRNTRRGGWEAGDSNSLGNLISQYKVRGSDRMSLQNTSSPPRPGDYMLAIEILI